MRDDIGIYNTCAGPGYVGTSARQESANWGVGSAGRFEDLDGFLHRPAALAKELVAERIGGMKVWPFDTAAKQPTATTSHPLSSTQAWGAWPRSGMRSATT